MDAPSYQAAFSATAIVLSVVAFIPYIANILRGSTRPHVFSWVIWAISTFIVFLAQLDAKGGVGAWPIGVSALITAGIAGLAHVRRGDIRITPADWAFFVAALGSLPLWYLAADPLWAVVVLTVVDTLGFGPTLRKVYRAPYSESLPFYALIALRNVLVVAALETRSVTTVLFPAVMALACTLLIALLWFRRRVLPPP